MSKSWPSIHVYMLYVGMIVWTPTN